MSNILNLHTCYGGRITPEQQEKLNDVAYDIRVKSINLISRCNWGHPGGSLSLAELMAVLYGGAANIRPDNAVSPLRDYVILSKAHCSPALYATLNHFGFIDDEAFFKYATVSGIEGHIAKGNPKGIECSGGSLGMGLSYAVGLANAIKLQEGYSQSVYCICGDGETNEGQIWEAAMSAAQYKLDNLTVLIDYNKVMAKNFVYNGMGVEPLKDKFKAFGFEVYECDGHDVNDIVSAIYKAKYISVVGKPKCIILNTVKGRGVEECEFNCYWHTHAPNMETANRFLKTLADNYGKEFVPITSTVKGSDGGIVQVIEEALR